MRSHRALSQIAPVVAVAITGLFSAKFNPKVIAQVVAKNVTVPYSITYGNILTDDHGKQTDLGTHVDEQRPNGDRSQLWPLGSGKTKRIIEFVAAGLTVSASDVNDNISTMGKGSPGRLIPNYACRANHSRDASVVGKEDILDGQQRITARPAQSRLLTPGLLALSLAASP